MILLHQYRVFRTQIYQVILYAYVREEGRGEGEERGRRAGGKGVQYDRVKIGDESQSYMIKVKC